MSSFQSTPVRGPTAHDSVAALRGVALANAVTTVAVAVYLLCAALAIVAPDVLVAFFQPWFHGLSLAPLRPAGPWFRPGEFALGLVSFGGSVWLVTAAIVGLYNRWSQR